MFSHVITVFNIKRNAISGLDEYKRHIIGGVHWEDESVIKLGDKSIQTDNKTEIVIPMNIDGYIAPNDYKSLEDVTGSWTLKEGDIIAKGSVESDITHANDLQGEARIIKSISIVDYAINSKLNNYTIECK